MNCPSCGAAMRQAGNRPHFHCPECGAFDFPDDPDEGLTVTGEPVGAACPVCRLPLQSAAVENETVCYCERCRGFLAPIDAFGRIVGKRRVKHGPHDNCGDPFDPAELERVLHCPNCGGRMDAHPYSGGGSAVVDTCEDCALIWLDAGELAIIARFAPHSHHIEPVHTLPDAAPTGGVLDILFPGPRRGLFSPGGFYF